MAKELDEDLIRNEKVIYRAELHWVTFFSPSFWMTCGVLMIPFVDYFKVIFPEKWVFYGAYGLFGYGAFLFLFEYIRHRSSVFVVTNNRVFVKMGIIQRDSLTINLHHIETVDIQQSILGRMLNFGTINITASGGTGLKKPIDYLNNPMLFRKYIQAYIRKPNK
ncbi:MAG TPA: hypothetical protein DCM08_06555 [Microscillaceae bacterium]|nr:hypothetical protein [Microscillaceae bacterium]